MNNMEVGKRIVLAACLRVAEGVAAASPAWTFMPSASPADGGSGTIVSADGAWELNVRIADASKKTLSLGQKSNADEQGGGHAFVRGAGDLDVRGAVTRAGTAEAWKIVDLAYGSLGRGAASGFREPASFYAPFPAVTFTAR